MTDRYNVVLEGRARPEANVEAVIPDLASLIGRDQGFARELLSGQRVVLRSGVPRGEADEAVAALTRIGVLAVVEHAADLQIDADVEARVHQRSRPSLWNPNAAACWSLLFTPVFGAFLHWRNWHAMQRTDRVRGAGIWLGASIAVFVVSLVASVVVPSTGTGLRVFNFVYLLCWYFSAARPQVRVVKDEFRGDYQRRGWLVPLLIALAAAVASMLVAGALAAMTGGIVIERSGTTSL